MVNECGAHANNGSYVRTWQREAPTNAADALAREGGGGRGEGCNGEAPRKIFHPRG